MKYLAVLRDSLREALDSKVHYATIFISLLVFLFVASTTLTPATVQEKVEDGLGVMNFVTHGGAKGLEQFGIDKCEKFEVGTFERLDAAKEPWVPGQYRFTIKVTLKPGTNAKDIPAERLGDFMHHMFEWFPKVQIKQIESPDKQQASFAVEAEGIAAAVRTRGSWYHQPGFFFGLYKAPLRFYSLQFLVQFVCITIIGNFGNMAIMLISTILTAFLIPNMLAKGSVDLLLSKPINRISLFINKFLGGMTFMFVNAAIIMTFIYLGVGLQTGVWVHSILLAIVIYTFQFAILYSASAMVGAFTRSAILSMLAVVFLWLTLWGVGWINWFAIEAAQADRGNVAQVVPPEERSWVLTGLEVIHAVLPRYDELDWKLNRNIRHDLAGAKEEVEEVRRPQRWPQQKGPDLDWQTRVDKYMDTSWPWWTTIGVSSLFIVVMVGAGAAWFATRDY